VLAFIPTNPGRTEISGSKWNAQRYEDQTAQRYGGNGRAAAVDRQPFIAVRIDIVRPYHVSTRQSRNLQFAAILFKAWSPRLGRRNPSDQFDTVIQDQAKPRSGILFDFAACMFNRDRLDPSIRKMGILNDCVPLRCEGWVRRMNWDCKLASREMRRCGSPGPKGGTRGTRILAGAHAFSTGAHAFWRR